MTNNQLCSLVGIIGCLCAFFGMCLVFFGVTPAWIVTVIGIIMGKIALMNFDQSMMKKYSIAFSIFITERGKEGNSYDDRPR